MDNGIKGAGLLRLIGVMAIGVGVIWALQVLAFGDAGAAFARMSWVLGAATIAGGGAGLIFASGSLREATAEA